MRRFDLGDRVRIDIPDTTDPDFDNFHGRTGNIVKIFTDDLAEETADTRDSRLFTVQFNDGSTKDFRWRDLRPRGSER